MKLFFSDKAPPVSSQLRAVVWGIVAVAVLVNSLRLAWNLYDAIWWFDEVIHAYTTFALLFPLVFWLYGVILIGADHHPLLFILVVIMLGLGLGAAWEVAEWSYDQVTRGNLILGKFDTITDLIMDAGGAFLAGWLVARIAHKENSPNV